MAKQTSKASDDAADADDSAVYWFCILDTAKERADFDLAARAKDELARLGVRVSFQRRRERVRDASGGDSRG